MARFLVRAYKDVTGGVDLPLGGPYFSDVEGLIQKDDVNRAAAVGLTGGQNGDKYVPQAATARGRGRGACGSDVSRGTLAAPPASRGGPVAVRSRFERAVREAAEGTPYVVTRTDDGFDVTLDVGGRWAGPLHEAGVRQVHTHHVVVADDDTYTVTDDVRTVEWEAGVARLSASAQRVRGRAVQHGVEQTWTLGRGGLRKTSGVRYGDGQGRALVRAAAQSLGLTERRGGAERIGLVFAVVGAAGAVVTLLVLAAQALLGGG